MLIAAGALLVLVLVGPGRVAAAEPAPAEIAQAIRDLGASAYRVREQAGECLWRAGPAAETALRQALTNDDPEVVIRAREILGKLSYGIYPDTPPEVVELLRQFKAGDRMRAVMKLVDLEEAGFRSLAYILRTVDHDGRLEIADCLSETNAIAIPNLLKDGKDERAENRLKLGAATGKDNFIRDQAAWLLCRGRLRSHITSLQADPEPGPVVLRQLVYLHRANGDLTNAIACALRLEDPELTRKLRFESGDWQALARDPGESEGIERMGFQAAYQRLAGNRVEFEQALQALRAHAARPLPRDQTWYVAKAFLLNDRIQDAMELLRRAKMRRYLLDLLNAQGRYEEAFRLVEQAREEEDRDLLSIELEQARVQYSLGETNEARTIVRRVLAATRAVADAPLTADQDDADDAGELGNIAKKNRPQQLSANIIAAVSVGLIQEAAELAAQAIALLPAEKAAERHNILQGLYPDFAGRADAWLSLLSAEFPRTKPAAHLAGLYGYFTGRRESLREYIVLADKATAAMSNLTPRAQQHLWQSLSDAHEILGAHDRAAACERRACEVSKPSADHMRLVRKLSMAAQWREAAATAREAYVQFSGPWFLWACGWATIHAGDEKAGREEVERADLMALAHEYIRDAMADLLRTWKINDAAARQESMSLRLGDFDSWKYGKSFWYLMDRAGRTNDFATYFKMQEQDRLGCLRKDRWYNDRFSYLDTITECHAAAARLALAGGRTEEALEHIRVAQEASPLSTDFVIIMVPLLEKAGRKDVAKEIFQRVLQRLTEVCRRFPRNVNGHNGIAWLAARTRRELLVGLEHARMAVKVDPAAHGCRDTLAEVLFQLGRRDEAVAEMQKCVEQEPGKTYYRRQLKRMQEDDPATEPSPETD